MGFLDGDAGWVSCDMPMVRWSSRVCDCGASRRGVLFRGGHGYDVVAYVSMCREQSRRPGHVRCYEAGVPPRRVSERHVIYPRLFPPIQAIYSLEAFSLSGDNAIPQAPGGGWG